jgi:hypothetical protein
MLQLPIPRGKSVREEKPLEVDAGMPGENRKWFEIKNRSGAEDNLEVIATWSLSLSSQQPHLC